MPVLPAIADEVISVKRREFIAGLGSATAWPGVARAQPNERMRRVGFLSGLVEHDALAQGLQKIFWQRLAELGWEAGRNLRTDERFAAGENARYATLAGQLVNLSPDVIVSNTTPAVAALHHATDRIPIVFIQIWDPVAAGFVSSLARPGGNLTGFSNFEYTISGKWLEFMRQMIPSATTIGMLVNPDDPAGRRYQSALETEARRHAVQLTILEARTAGDLARVIDAWKPNTGGGLIVFPTSLTVIHRDLIIAQVKRHRVPAIYGDRTYAADGGLMSYGPDRIDLVRRAAGYVDRILRGAKPADLPVEQPIRFDFVINLATAQALGLTIPETLLAIADEVIQ